MKVTNEAFLIEVATSTYPLSLSQVRARLPDVSFGAEPDEEVLNSMGYAVVVSSPKPFGDIVTEGAPLLSDAGFAQTWEVRSFTPEEQASLLAQRKAQVSFDVAALVASTLAVGGSHVFPDGATEHIQLRDGDRANITGLQVRADRDTAAGRTKIYYFRTYENNIKPLTAEQIGELADAAFVIYNEILMTCWALKDQADAATDLAGIPEIPATLAF